jgi:hypothetical protein
VPRCVRESLHKQPGHCTFAHLRSLIGIKVYMYTSLARVSEISSRPPPIVPCSPCLFPRADRLPSSHPHPVTGKEARSHDHLRRHAIDVFWPSRGPFHCAELEPRTPGWLRSRSEWIGSPLAGRGARCSWPLSATSLAMICPSEAFFLFGFEYYWI